MATVSVVIQFLEDYDFITRVVELLAWADEFIVNDGPFLFTRDLLEPLVGRDLAQPSARAIHLFGHLSSRLGVPIHYHHGVFEDERAKRIHGYGLATGDVVLSVDADELLLLDRHAVERFWESEARVASFDCFNCTYLNLMCGKAGCALVARKPFAFKRAAIAAELHLNYLWLVGVNQTAVPAQDFLPEALCAGAHLSTVRSSYGASIKFGFYNCLYFRLRGESLGGSFGEARTFFSKGSFSSAAQARVYARASPDAIGFPYEHSFFFADPDQVPEPIRDLADEACAPFNEPLPHHMLGGNLVPGVSTYALMRAGNTLRVSLSIGGQARVRVVPLLQGGPPLDLSRPWLESQWQAEPLQPRDLAIPAATPEVIHATIGHLVELVVWCDAATKASWAEASLTPAFSMSVHDQPSTELANHWDGSLID